MEAPLLAQDLYKHTIVGDYVVKRHAKLFRDRFETSAPGAADASDFRTFRLDASARLSPASRDGMRVKRRHLRPRGVGSMTALAALRGTGAPLDLWTFKVEGGALGSFVFGFDDQAQALRWYDALSQAIADLRVLAGLSDAPTPRPSAATSDLRTSDGRGAGTAPDTPRGPDASSVQVSFHSMPSHLAGNDRVMSHTSHAGDGDDEMAALLDFPTGSAPLSARRWVPFRHSNGLAIYKHHAGPTQSSDEYMVSAVIRGSPVDVLRALVDPGSATTILGPALEVEVLDSQPGRQVLRIQLAALGPTAAWFRPREAVVQRLLKRDEDGVYVLLFSSTHTALAPAQHEGVVEVAEGLGHVRRAAPIRCRVSGGYTISKLAGVAGSHSHETLLTCVLQVEDMGGWLNPAHPMFRPVNWASGGAYEAFLERMLLGVTVVRDMVESARFAVKPTMHCFQERSAAADEAGDAEADDKALPGLRSSTFVMRQAQSLFAQPGSGASPFAGSAQALAPASAGGSAPGHRLHKTSRLASLRLPSTGLDAARSRALSGTALPEGEEGQHGAEAGGEWDSSFKLPAKFYEEIHTPACEHPFKVRGPNYLADGVKVTAGTPMFELLGVEVVDTGSSGPLPHVSRFLPSIRRSAKPFVFVFNLMVPGPPTMCCVFGFGANAHPDSLGPPPDDPEDSDWQPFDFLMWRFLHGDDEERRSLFKMVPRIAEGSWVIKQSVGTTPVILGRKLTTSFHITPKYVEVAVDVGSSTTAQYVTGMVRGGCKNLVLDLGVVLEGHNSWELPEELLGAVRVNRLDLAAASKLDDSREVPMLLAPGAPAASAESQAGDTASTAQSQSARA